MNLGELLHHVVEGRKIPRKKSETIYPTVQGNISENFGTINTAKKTLKLGTRLSGIEG